MNLQDVSHIHIPDGDVRMIHDSDNRLLWGAVGYNVLFSGNTFQQTYKGKNILDYITGLIASGGGLTNTINNDGTITTVGTPNGDYNRIIEYYDLTPYLEDGATYTLSSTLYDNKTFAQVRCTKISDSSAYNYDTLVRAKSFTVDKSQYTYRMGIMANTMAAWGDESLTITKGYQLEKSATATSYEPYVGGQASPNPDYPQQIQTVTGVQTVSINGTNYPISLGSIELCDIGGYRDYIYKDGDSWKVHKATNSITYDGTNYGFTSRVASAVSGKYRFLLDGSETEMSNAESSSGAYFIGVCDKLISGTRNNTFVASGNVIAPRGESAYGNVGVVYMEAIAEMTQGQANSWLTTHNMTLKYALVTPTDTTITDTNLIAQLEAIYNLVRRYGYNFVVSASGNNLPIIIDRTLL